MKVPPADKYAFWIHQIAGKHPPPKERRNYAPPPVPIILGTPLTLIQHWVCCTLCTGTSANTWYSHNAVSILTHSLWRWTNIELDDCPVFALTVMRVTLYSPKGQYPGSTIHWPNCEIMLGHHLRRWANIIPIKTPQALNHEYNREYLFFWRLFKYENTYPRDFKRYILHVHKDWCTEMSNVSNTQHPSFPQVGHKIGRKIDVIVNGLQPGLINEYYLLFIHSFIHSNIRSVTAYFLISIYCCLTA